MKVARTSSWLAALVVVEACGGPVQEPYQIPDTSGGNGNVAAGGASGSSNAGTGAVDEPGVLFIQEDELGFSGVEGKVLPREGSTSITGYTGTGFADGDSGIGKSIGYSLNASAAGTVRLTWRYAFGGDAANLRDARLVVNGRVAAEIVPFPYTTTWNDWQESAPLDVELDQGSNFIRLEAISPSGLGNIDYFRIAGEGVEPAEPRFTLAVEANDPVAGSVSVEPQTDSYLSGQIVTLSAVAHPGYFFQSWSGDVTSVEAAHSFAIRENLEVTGLFLPEGTLSPPELVGYAAVQDDSGTPYVLTGGSLGESVTATTLEELEALLESEEPLVVSFSGQFQGTQSIQVASNKTLLGGADAHLSGVELQMAGSRNVIIRNVAVSHVVAEGAGEANDAIVITDGARNIWIDHCELFSDLDHGKDYYDGLLEIKNGASFVTVSWTEFHDHYKVSLMSSGEEQIGDTVIRATFHHNYFHHVNSRLPSIRFGKAHVFNNYYLEISDGSCVNSRMGAVVKVESNYFEGASDTVGSWDSPMPGFYEVSNNVFLACSGAQPVESNATLAIPYPYALDDPNQIPSIVVAGAGVGKLASRP
jgi:pectate lyase